MTFLLIYLLILLCGAAVLFIIHKKRQKDAQEEKSEKDSETANDFMNVTNIINNILYTKDAKMCAYFKINPVNIDLMSDRDMQKMTEALTAEFSSLRHPFKIIAASTQEDISPIMAQYSRVLQSSDDPKIRAILRNEIQERQTQVQNAEVPSRNYYCMIWAENETAEEFDKRMRDFLMKFNNCGIRAEIILQKDIIEMIELTANPQYAVAEDINPEFNFLTILKQYESGERDM